MLARDVMSVNVVTVGQDATVNDIATLLLERNISAVPVVDADGKVLGIVSEGDLMRRPEADTAERKRSWWLDFVTGAAEAAAEYTKTHGRLASDVMTRDVVTVTGDTPLSEVAQTLEERHIKRVPVVEGGRLVGIVSRANLLRALATRSDVSPAAISESDQTLQEKLNAALRDEPWANLTFVNATVIDGVVHLWGMVESAEQAKALRIAAEAIPGVKGVDDHVQPWIPQRYWAE